MKKINKIYKKFKTSVSRLLKIIRREEMQILPGHLAFFLVLSIAPIITIISFIASLYGVSLSSVLSFIQDSIPKDIYDLLIPFFSNIKISGNAIFFTIVGLFISSNGPHAIVIAANTLYKAEKEDYIHRRVKAFWITIILVLLFFFVLFVVSFGSIILKYIFAFGVLKNIENQAIFVLWLFKYPIAYILVYFLIKLIYTIAPNVKIPSRSVTKGALFTTFTWLLVSYAFSFYITNMASYDVYYGSLSSIIVMMIWAYLLSYILIIGMVINSDNYLTNIKNKNKITE